MKTRSEGVRLEAADVERAITCQAQTVGMSTFGVGVGGLGARDPSATAGRLAPEHCFRRNAMKHLLLSAVAIITVWSCDLGRAAEVTLIAPGGIRAAVEQMIPDFERATGHKVKATFGSGGGTKERVIKGEPFDVPVVQLPLEPVIASGHVVTASETPLATVSVGVAVRTGAPKPDISTADAVKRLLLGSKAIAYPNAASGAAAGVSFNETLEKLGITEVMKPKIKVAQGGRGAMELLAKGEVDIGLTFISEIITEPGVEVVGPLPRDISTPTVLVGFVSVHSKEPEAAKTLVRYLSSPKAAAVYKERGMQPGR
jgi:molybdate transport system substrate-binding protein